MEAKERGAEGGGFRAGPKRKMNKSEEKGWTKIHFLK